LPFAEQKNVSWFFHMYKAPNTRKLFWSTLSRPNISYTTQVSNDFYFWRVKLEYRDFAYCSQNAWHTFDAYIFRRTVFSKTFWVLFIMQCVCWTVAIWTIECIHWYPVDSDNRSQPIDLALSQTKEDSRKYKNIRTSGGQSENPAKTWQTHTDIFSKRNILLRKKVFFSFHYVSYV